MPMQSWLSYLLPTRPPLHRWADKSQLASALTEPGATAATEPPGSRLNDLSGTLFNSLIIVSIVLAIGLLFFCLCSWFKLMACRLCCRPAANEDDEESDVEIGDGDGRRRRWRRSRSRRHQVVPARRATPSWLTGEATSGRYPTPPPSYFESVDQLGMPPTPPPGYLSARQAAAASGSAATSTGPSTGPPLPVIVVDATNCAEVDDKSADDLAALARVGIHRSCPNIRLVAPAQDS